MKRTQGGRKQARSSSYWRERMYDQPRHKNSLPIGTKRAWQSPPENTPQAGSPGWEGYVNNVQPLIGKEVTVIGYFEPDDNSPVHIVETADGASHFAFAHNIGLK